MHTTVLHEVAGCMIFDSKKDEKRLHFQIFIELNFKFAL